MKLKDMLIDAVGKLAERVVPKQPKKAVYLTTIFVWQEISSFTEKKLKEAWSLAWEAGVIPSDDALRAAGEGEAIVCESDRFSCVAKVTKPRETFDRDKFIGELVRLYKLKRPALEALAEQCKSEGKAALSKRVLEA